MPTTTISVRDVDLDVWKEFQKRIIDLYGSLYGQLGTEVTKALKLWLEKTKVPEKMTKKYIILNVGRNHSVKGNPNLKTLLERGLWGLKERYRKQWERINIGDPVLIYSNGGIRAKGKIVNKQYSDGPVNEWDNPYGYPYLVEIELENIQSTKKLPEIKIPLSELERYLSFNSRSSIRIIEDERAHLIERLLKEVS